VCVYISKNLILYIYIAFLKKKKRLKSISDVYRYIYFLQHFVTILIKTRVIIIFFGYKYKIKLSFTLLTSDLNAIKKD